MSKANQKQLLAGISKITDVLAELEDFFHNADVDISNDPDDPREGIGRLFGLDRLICLIPCVVNRLEEDNSTGKAGENITSIMECLQAIQEGIQGVLAYYQRDDVEVSLEILSKALSKIDNLSNKKPPSGVRVFRNIARIARIAPDFQIIHNMFEEFRENRRIRPEDLKTDAMKNRDAAFNPDFPEKFLDLSEIPDTKDEEGDGDYEVRVVNLHYEEEEPEPWASSLPELHNWNKASQESVYDDPERYHPDFKDDPVYQLLNPFVHDIIECLKHDYHRRVKESESHEYVMRSPLEHYIIILALKAQVRIASCGVHTEIVGHDAPRKGVYLFAMECLEKIAKATHKFSQKHLYHLAAEARNIKKQIEEIIDENG